MKVYCECVCACLPDAGIDMRTPRNFLMRADRKVRSFLALEGEKKKQETSQKQKKTLQRNIFVNINLSEQAREVALLLSCVSIHLIEFLLD